MAPSRLAELLCVREGHFRFESGHHGRLWLDLDRLFLRPASVRPLSAALAGRLARHGITAVCGPLTGGAFVAQHLAEALDLRFFAAQRHQHHDRVTYRLPAGVHQVLTGQRIAVVDDVLNAGSAVATTARELRHRGGEVVAVGGLLALGDGARRTAEDLAVPLEVVETWPHELWSAEQCPRCARGEALTDPP
ncbi:orotate phosphoribosyltransferase [Saccharopolyspora erythraea NRRL 2338]|uniref:Orotate phosphoribosyltransferase n=2 Tax=Saccharopolyspora erythraea TaxID=1836 RepID=A4FFZ0_SACEN|nr:phosphoribosyltransferase family protein [Saccharopolyspora erythraea]EQD84028.1 orotate phosphoribosyltransferase [Saccharopolyspora erythraea D]PFG96670.1 orotate phosphoribosyltransferase [Saccharopolyspora erythraea NRRL 2338]QRK93148.1 orotate phosphoribosyltransferase [Saccharopolyspora erythraea]CAM02965.1 orotate phosphoribosyltransferase [Saccharopolyspora erythraea NRRL 2338]